MPDGVGVAFTRVIGFSDKIFAAANGLKVFPEWYILQLPKEKG